MLTLTVVNTTAAREPKVGVATQMIETTTTAATAVSLIAHWGMSSGDTSARVVCQKRRFMYSAKIRLITALPPAAVALLGQWVPVREEKLNEVQLNFAHLV